MALSPKIAKVLDAACSTIRTGADGQTVLAATGTTTTGALIFSNPVLLTCVGVAALGFAGWSIYRDLKSDNDLKQLQCALMEMIKQRGSLAAAAEDNFDSLELGQIDASIDLDQLKSGLQKLYKFSALNRRERHQQAAEHAGLIESLQTFADARFGEISSQLDEALSILRPRPRFGIKEAPTSTDALASLRFTNRTVELVGRQQELEQLDAFLDNTPKRDSDFAFWLMTGPGGMGKSRLAHELCLHRFEDEWDTGFWEHSATDVWHKWQPDAPTLIVFDYLFGRPDEIANAISAMAGRRLDFPVRFLVLEREARGAWWERVSAHEAGKTRQDLSGYQHTDSSLKLSGLDEDAAKAFFRDAQPDASEDQITEFAQVFRTTDPQGRPLYAQAIVEAARDFGISKTGKLSRAALVLFILKKERTRTANFIKDDATRNSMQNLLAISTLARGLSRDEHDLWEDPELSRLLPPENAFNIEDFRAIASSSSEHTIPGLEPDLVGEMFVLQQLATTSAANRKRIVHAAWHRKPEDTALMCDMAIRDFSESDWIDSSNDLDLQNKITKSKDLQAIIDSIRPPSYIREGNRAFFDNDFKISIANYTQVIKLPDAPVDQVANALINRGLVYRKLQRWDDAIADYTQVIKLPDAPVDRVANALYNRGVIYGELERTDDAIADYTQVVKLPDASVDRVAEALINRGFGYGQLQRTDDAIADSTRVIELPDVPMDMVADALCNRGVVYGELERTDDAIADYTQIIKLPDAPVDVVANALCNRGVVYGQLERTDDAIADYTQVIKLPDAPVDRVANALYNRGVIYGELERTDDAIADYTQVIKLPDASVDRVAEALYNRGTTYSQHGRTDDAIADYTQVIKLPDAPVDRVAKALLNQGTTYLQLGRTDDAIADCTQVIELPDAPVDRVADALCFRGVLYGQLKRTDDAIADCTQVIELPDAPVDRVAKALHDRGFFYGQLKRTDDAIADYTQVIKLPDAPVDMVANALVNRGETYIGLGEFSLAIHDLAVALGMSEVEDEVRQEAIGLLKAVYRSEEHDEAARRMAEKVLRDAGIDLDE